MNPQHLDFELEITESTDGGYTVTVVRSPAGEARTTMIFPFSELELKNHLLALENALLRSGGRRRQSLTPEEQTVKDFGLALFNMVMVGDVGSLYYESQRESSHAGKGLRLKLRIQPPELAVLPWEFLFDPRRNEYICLSSHTPLVRYPDVAQPPQPMHITPPLRILGMVANPRGLDELDVALEKQRVETALQAEERVELTWLQGQTWRDLQRALRRETWHIFHFIGHGAFDEMRDEGMLILANDAGNAAPLRASQLAHLLANHRTLRLVLLNACDGARGSSLDVYASTAGTLIRRGLPAVLAMQYVISDGAAIEFVQTFYEAIADGLPVDNAVAEARVAVSLAITNTLEWGTPVLYMRAPNGEVFTMTKKTRISSTRQEEPIRDVPIGAAISKNIADESPAQRRMREEIDWVTIPAGEFLMGSDKVEDKDADADELPQHRLYLPVYRIARTPVTVAQFAAFVTATGYKTTAESEGWAYGWKGNGWDRIEGANWRRPHGPKSDVTEKDQHPVTSVSWHDTWAYCQWLSQSLGQGVRLPSEAEWEKAARGTDGRIYPWGNEQPDKIRCNFDRDVGDTTPVGQYCQGSSPYGCLDMAGNVWEWTSSLWGKAFHKPEFGYPYNANDGREHIVGPDDGYRVVRGGSFGNFRLDVRCACRLRNLPDIRFNGLGFRVLSPGL